MSQTDPNILSVEKTGMKLSPIWIVPIIAAVLALVVAWSALSDRGPLVEIEFAESKGIKAGKTEIKHKDVVIGVVEKVVFKEDLNGVIVTARLAPEVEPFLGETTDFWIVSADFSGSNFSGVETLLSGAYIEVDWSEKPRDRFRDFKGLAKPPLTPPSEKGRHFSLRAPGAGSASAGSPIYYRGVKVGQVDQSGFGEDYSFIQYSAFIQDPYDQLVTEDTVFWNVSGLSVSVDSDGFSLDMASLDSLIAGGIAFGSRSQRQNAPRVEEGQVFALYESREAAMESRFASSTETSFQFLLRFDESVAGLSVGAPVEWQGIRLGTVTDVRVNLLNETVDVVISMQPSRLGIQDATEATMRARFQQWVDEGMRVRLASGNILTGQKLIHLVDNVSNDPYRIDFDAGSYPELPTAPSEFNAIAKNTEELIGMLSSLPLNDLVVAATDLLNSVDTVVSQPASAQLPGQLKDTLASFGDIADGLGSDLPGMVENLDNLLVTAEATVNGLSPDSEMYVNLANSLVELRAMSRSLSALLTVLEQQPNALLTGKN